MPLYITQTLNIVLAIMAIGLCFVTASPYALTAAAIVALWHIRQLKPGEWRILIQIAVLGWVINAVFLRMQWLEVNVDGLLINRILCWPLLATTFCHSAYILIKKLYAAALLGAIWGAIYFLTPVLLGQYSSALPYSLLIIYAAVSGALVLLIFSFIIRTRIFFEKN